MTATAEDRPTPTDPHPVVRLERVESWGDLVRRLDSDVRELRREQSIARQDARECREATKSLEARVGELLDRYPVVAGMTPAQRAGASAGIGGAMIAIAAALPEILRALHNGWGQ